MVSNIFEPSVFTIYAVFLLWKPPNLEMNTEYETLLSDVSRLFASPLPWSCNASSNEAERIIIEETGALLAVYMGEIPVHLGNKDTLSDEKLDKIALLLASLLTNLEDLVSDDIPLWTTVREFILFSKC